MKPSRIAIIGTGVAGLTAAWILQRRHAVTLYEKNDYIGGHTHTIVLPTGPDQGTPVDTGFIVFNDRNYPMFNHLLKQLDIQDMPSDMSFGYSDPATGLAYSSYVPNGLFARRSNVFRIAFLKMIGDILRFNRNAKKDLATGSFSGRTLGQYVQDGRYGREFRDHYLIPMGAAIWSAAQEQMLNFPAEHFARFFFNHGLLDLKDRPHWKTIPGGAKTYVDALLKQFHGEVKTASPVASVRRTLESVIVREASGWEESYDYAVLASHADESLKLLADPMPEEARLLGTWRYSKNRAVLHSDVSHMPANRRAWASWNYIAQNRDSKGSVSVTYDMNRLQSLKTSQEYFVTLNPALPIEADKIIADIQYTHPVYDDRSMQTQKELPKLNGPRRTFFCGSYFGFGFHEDAVKSANQMASHFGLEL